MKAVVGMAARVAAVRAAARVAAVKEAARVVVATVEEEKVVEPEVGKTAAVETAAEKAVEATVAAMEVGVLEAD